MCTQLPMKVLLILKIHLCFLQHVMKFAEITQEIQMSQPTAIKLDFGFTPGRRKANQVSLVYEITCTL